MKGHYGHQIEEKRYTQEDVDAVIQEALAKEGWTDEDFARREADVEKREQAADEQIARLATRYGIPLDILKYGIGGKPNPSNTKPETGREIAIWDIAQRHGADPVELKDLNLSIEETEEMAKSGKYNKEVQMEGKTSREIYSDYFRNKAREKQNPPSKTEMDESSKRKESGEKRGREHFAEYFRDKEAQKTKKETETGATVIRREGTPLNEAIDHWPYFKPGSKPSEEKTSEEEASEEEDIQLLENE